MFIFLQHLIDLDVLASNRLFTIRQGNGFHDTQLSSVPRKVDFFVRRNSCLLIKTVIKKRIVNYFIALLFTRNMRKKQRRN